MDSPTVSVVMSVFNGQAYLSEAIESILAQSLREFEFLIIDDGSTDRTGEIVAEYAKHDARIRLIRQQNNGRATSLNAGIALARSNYIARMDADDIALPHRLQQQVEFMDHNSDVGLLGGAYELINAKGETLSLIRPPLADPDIRSLVLQYNPMCHPTVLMRKQVALAAGGYRRALLDADDYDLWVRMSERTLLANLKEPVLRYRLHSEQVSIQNMRHQALCALAVRAAARVRRQTGTDPLSEVQEITPQMLDGLGITPAEIQKALLVTYRHWTGILALTEPEAALRVTDGFLALSSSECFNRSVVADAWLTAAGFHYRLGHPVKALSSVGRAILARPVVAGRPVKRALTRLAAAFKS